MIKSLQALSGLNAVSGSEAEVRNWILSQISDQAECKVDVMGNLLCFKKGKQKPSKRILWTTHMDEVGFLITNVTEDGLFKFTAVGAIDERVVLGRAVRLLNSGQIGVVGTKAIHQQTQAERGLSIPIDDMFIDVGATTKEQALQIAPLGSYVSFVGQFEPLGNCSFKGKALNDRVGCAILLQLMQMELPYDSWFAFTVQDKIGMRGAQTAAYTVNPDIAIIVEGTEAIDISGVQSEKQLCQLGRGAVLTFMDKLAIYNKELVEKAIHCAGEHSIPYQIKTTVDGVNGAGMIQVSRGGVNTLSVGIPCRYVHSANTMIHMCDVDNAYQLLEQIAHVID